MKTKILLPILSIGLLAGCMNSNPSEEDGRKALKKYIASKAKIVSFEKTNGKKEGENGYIMYFKAVIEYPEGLNTQCLEKNLPVVTAFGKVIGRDRSHCMTIDGQRKAMEVGAKEIMETKIYFEKTEKGWIGHVGGRYGLF